MWLASKVRKTWEIEMSKTSMQLIAAAGMTVAQFDDVLRKTVDQGGWDAVRANPVYARIMEARKRESALYVDTCVDV